MKYESYGIAGTRITSNVSDYNKSANIIEYLISKYDRKKCNFNRLKMLFVLSDRYHIRMYGNTISNSRMYEYNYFLTMLKKYVDKLDNFKFDGDDLNLIYSTSDAFKFNELEIKTLDFVFDYFKKYNNNQLQRYYKSNIKLIKYCSQFFNNIEEEYCDVPQSLLENNINKYDALCDQLDIITQGKSVYNKKIKYE